MTKREIILRLRVIVETLKLIKDIKDPTLKQQMIDRIGSDIVHFIEEYEKDK